jgi:alkylation response protein AidB-like acyl-CoA dehydrogenase
MHFAFTDQQTEFRDTVRQVLTKECTADDLRAAFDAPVARGPRWSLLAELGVVGLTVPEAHGGLGLDLLDLVLLLEEAGRVGLPEPLLETTALAAPLLAEHDEWQPAGVAGETPGSLLAAIAAGSVAACVAESPLGSSSGAVNDWGSDSRPVAGAVGADLFVLLSQAGVSTDAGPHAGPHAGPQIHLVARDRLSVTPSPSLDPTRRRGVIQWTPTAETLVASGKDAQVAIQATIDRAAVATAAELLGLCDRMIGMTAEYAKARHQFGKPIGSFQAVKHLLANAAVKLEFARPVVYAAAWHLDQRDAGEPDAASAVDASRFASTAKTYASDAASEAARVALQVHGAIGYTWECDLHLFLKRTWALAEAWGSAADHRQRVLSSLTSNP